MPLLLIVLEKTLVKAVKFPFGAVRFSPPNHLIKKPSAFSWRRSRPAALVWNTSYIHGRMDGCIFRTCIDMNVICTPGKKAKRENRKREKIAARILQYIMHYVFPLLGLIVLDDIAAGYTPYSILHTSTEYGRGLPSDQSISGPPRGIQHGPDHGSWMCLRPKYRL